MTGIKQKDDLILEMLESGQTKTQICETLGIKRTTLQSYLERHHNEYITPRPRKKKVDQFCEECAENCKGAFKCPYREV